MAENSTRKQRGPGKPFQPGQSGNPAGKPRGAKNHATRMVQALLDSRGQEIAEKAINLALAGDGPVLRAILDRLCPAKRDAPVSLVLPKIESAADIPAVTAAILEAVSAGRLTPSEAQAVAGLVEVHRKAVELADIEKRLAALEADKGA